MAAITSFTTTGYLCSVHLSWFVSGTDYTHVEVWKSPSNVVGSAELITTSKGTSHVDVVRLTDTFYYWIRPVNGDVPGNWFSSSGELGKPDETLSAFLNTLQGKIHESQLTDGFLARINGFIESGKTIDFDELRNSFDTVQVGIDAVDAKYVIINDLINTLLAQFGLLDTSLSSDMSDLQIYIDNKLTEFTDLINVFNDGFSLTMSDGINDFLLQLTQVASDIEGINTFLIQLESDLSTDISNAYALVNDTYSTIVNLTSATASKVTTLEANFSNLEANTNAAITTEQLARASGDSALASQISSLSASYDSFTTSTNASINDMQLVFTSANEALAQQITTFSTDFTSDLNQTNATLQNQITVLSSDTQALSQEITTYTAQLQNDINTFNAAITTQMTALATEDVALTTLINELSVSLTTDTDALSASILAEQTARVDADSALASDFLTLNTTINDNSATLTVHAQTLDGIQADWGVTTNVNGHVAGIKLINGGDTSDFTVVADTFNILNPTTLNPIMEVNSELGKVCFTGEVCFGSALEDALVGGGGGAVPGSDGEVVEGLNETQFSEPYCALLELGDVTPGQFKGKYAANTDYKKGDIVWVTHKVVDLNWNDLYVYSNAYVVTFDHTTYSSTFGDIRQAASRNAAGHVKGIPHCLNALADTYQLSLL